MKKALIHDWFYTFAGGEKVVQCINEIYPEIELFSLIDFLSDENRKEILNNKKITTSFIQKLPFAKNNHRKYLSFFPQAIEQFDLRKYDLILSSSSSIAKGVLTNSTQLHICYIHSPMRYAWDLYHQYLEEANLKKGLKSWYAKKVLHRLRIWDVTASNRVDYFIANSNYIARRVKKIYNREAIVIYPPVDVENFSLEINKDDYYLAASRLVSYKKIDVIIKAFNNMPNKKLIVIGNGPEMKNYKNIANKNVSLLGFQSNQSLIKYMQKAKAFVFAAEEDFGILPVEAQACGTPVIAYGKGGALETVIKNETGLFFKKQTAKSIQKTINEFESLTFNHNTIRKNAERFSKNIFKSKYKKFVTEKYTEFHKNN